VNLDGHVVARELPVLLLDHLIVEGLVLVEQLIKVHVFLSVDELLLLLLVALLLFMNLNERVLHKQDVGFDQLDGDLQTLGLDTEVLGVPLH